MTVPGNTMGTLYWPSAGRTVSQFQLLAPGHSIQPAMDGDTVVVPLVPGVTQLAAR